MSKTIFTVLAVVGAALGVFGKAIGLTLDPALVLTGVASILVYVFGAAKTDLALIAQTEAFKDPKVWIAGANAALVALVEAGIVLPVSPEIIIVVLTAIMGLLFKPKEVIAALRQRKAAGFRV